MKRGRRVARVLVASLALITLLVGISGPSQALPGGGTDPQDVHHDGDIDIKDFSHDNSATTITYTMNAYGVWDDHCQTAPDCYGEDGVRWLISATGNPTRATAQICVSDYGNQSQISATGVFRGPCSINPHINEKLGDATSSHVNGTATTTVTFSRSILTAEGITGDSYRYSVDTEGEGGRIANHLSTSPVTHYLGATGNAYSFTPTAAPIGTSIHVTGTGCPPTNSPPPSGGDLSFAVLNGPGRSLFYESNPDGSYSFDYPIPPTRAGDQTDENIYGTEIFCFSSQSELPGPEFTITAPEYTLGPASGPPGTSVQFSGLGCFDEEETQGEGGFTFASGEVPVPFEPSPDYTFSGGFIVPPLPPGQYVTSITCPVQAAQSPAGTGGQELTGSRLFTITGPTSNARAPVDFAKDGFTDFGVFRPSVGGWYVKGQPTIFHGLPGDIPVPGDYGGTNEATLRAVFRPSVGGWYVRGQPTVFLGLSGDIPVPGDYDGNNTTNRAVFRPSVGGWYIHNYAGSPIFHGLPGDIPVPGDYDNDGDDDIAVFRPSVGGWYFLNQDTEVVTVVFHGLPGDIPVPADYDGDGDTDIAVYRDGAWLIKDQPTVFLGLAGDTPVPGDYVGSDAIDPAVYRSGIWYLKDQAPVFHGLADDIPTPKRPGP